MDGALERLVMLWIKSQSVLFSHLSGNITREVCLFLPLRPYIWVEDSTIRILDFNTLELGPRIPLSQTVYSQNSSWLAVDTNRVFLCGGGTYCML